MKKTNEQKEEEFIPFGDEWKNQMMKWSKQELVDIIKRIAIQNVDQQYEIRNLKRMTNRNEGRIKKALESIKPK